MTTPSRADGLNVHPLLNEAQRLLDPEDRDNSDMLASAMTSCMLAQLHRSGRVRLSDLRDLLVLEGLEGSVTPIVVDDLTGDRENDDLDHAFAACGYPDAPSRAERVWAMWEARRRHREGATVALPLFVIGVACGLAVSLLLWALK